jgi:ABC-type antimicrobial peptide transport system permease subunit
MTVWTVVGRSLRFYRRTHLGVLAGAVTAAAVLTGALFVGDSVRYSLRMMALARLGAVQVAMASADRFFWAALADEMALDLRDAQAVAAPILRLNGVAVTPDGASRANNVQVLGVDRRFWSLAPGRAQSRENPLTEGVALNHALAAQLGAGEGDPIVLRVGRPSVLPKDSPLFPKADAAKAFRLTVTRVLSDAEFGRFSLRADQSSPLSAFVPLEWLQERVELTGRANVLLLGGSQAPLAVERADRALRQRWQLADVGVEIRDCREAGAVEIRSDRIFLEEPLVTVAVSAAPEALGVLTYMVNELRAGSRSTPYSMVTAMGPMDVGNPADRVANPPTSLLENPALSDAEPDQIVISDWLAEDLEAKAGDALQMTYWVLGPNLDLSEVTNRFTVSRVVPLNVPGSGPDLMPAFPGVEGTESCRDWKSGLPLDFARIRPKDEEYWRDHRGTPKAFVSLSAGQAMWANRFGSLTAVRAPAARWTAATLAQSLKDRLDPATLGLFFQPVREMALKAGTESLDFGQLFLGFSFFLVTAAVLLMGLLFVFGVEQRRGEVGTLRAVGWPPRRVSNALLWEGGALAIVGGILGGACGVLYTRVVLYGLSTLWSDAVASAPLQFHASIVTRVAGTGAGIAVAVFAMWLALRKQMRPLVQELLTAGGEEAPVSAPASPASAWRLWWIGAALLAVALVAAGFVTGGAHRDTAGTFFASGALLLAAGLGWTRSLLARWGHEADSKALTLSGVSVRNAGRRMGRSLATVLLLACGSFLIVAAGANRQSAGPDIGEPSSGTGGFALIGQSALPFFGDLDSAEVRSRWGLGDAFGDKTRVVSLRVREGDDASCLNLNRAQTPRLLGVQPGALQAPRRFTFVKTMVKSAPDPWRLLDGRRAGGAVPAVGDEATIVWGLHKSAGDTLLYTDERGRTATLQIVGVLANSMLQGNLLISEENFTALFPSDSGYRMFLVDAPASEAGSLRRALTRDLEDFGLEVIPAGDRLAAFMVVENTYLSIFQVLGGLGLLLGSIGLGLVVARNILERRSELALLRAVGFRPDRLRRMMLTEHALLLTLGLGIGVLSAMLAVAPALMSSAAKVPFVSLGLTLAAVFLSGLLWTWLAVHLALRGPLLDALRNE